MEGRGTRAIGGGKGLGIHPTTGLHPLPIQFATSDLSHPAMTINFHVYELTFVYSSQCCRYANLGALFKYPMQD